MDPTLEPLYIYTCIYLHMHIHIHRPPLEVRYVLRSPLETLTHLLIASPLPWKENESNHMHPPLEGNVGHFHWKCDT